MRCAMRQYPDPSKVVASQAKLARRHLDSKDTPLWLSRAVLCAEQSLAQVAGVLCYERVLWQNLCLDSPAAAQHAQLSGSGQLLLLGCTVDQPELLVLHTPAAEDAEHHQHSRG